MRSPGCLFSKKSWNFAPLFRVTVPRIRHECVELSCCSSSTGRLARGRGGLILYRTRVPAGALNGRSVLDIGEPVRDYAKVR